MVLLNPETKIEDTDPSLPPLPIYKFTRIKDGFVVQSAGEKERYPAFVRFDKYLCAVDVFDELGHTDTLGIYQYDKIVGKIAEILMRFWRGHNYSKEHMTRHHRLKSWAIQNTVLGISKRVKEFWLEFESQIEPQRLQVIKRAVPLYFRKYQPILAHPEVYKNPYLVDDLLKYRGAIIALVELQEKVHHTRVQYVAEPDNGMVVDEKYSSEMYYSDNPLLMGENWRSFYAKNGETYKALNITLNHLPGHIRPSLVFNQLKEIKLERGITNRIELISLMLAQSLGIYTVDPDADDPEGYVNLHVFQHATEKELRMAFLRVANHIREPLGSMRSDVKMRDYIQFMVDYPLIHEGNVVGLADKSITWHRQVRDQNDSEAIQYYRDNPAVMRKPPIDLPNSEHITFMAHSDDFIAEYQLMDHCIYRYIPYGVRGVSYFFHIEKDGYIATAQVGAKGGVAQIRGPHNRDNPACTWGKRMLNHWSKGLADRNERK